jgi:chromate reductase
LLHAAQSVLPAGISYRQVHIGSLPLYNADISDPVALDAVDQFRNELSQADAFVISSPEYNFSIPGVLKNALDWASRGKDSPLINKPVAIMGASPGLTGTARMQMHLRQVFLFTNMHPVNKPEVFVNQAHTKFNEQGELIDGKTKELLTQQMNALKELTLQFKK